MDKIKERLESNNIIGDENDNEKLYVEISHVYTPRGDEILNVFSIQVPEKERHNGCATKIIKICEEIAQEREMKGIYVGPFMTDESDFLIKICKKNGYKSCMPFGMIKRFDGNYDTVNIVLDSEIYDGMKSRTINENNFH